MFLIDDDQAQIGEGQEQRGPCAHDQLRHRFVPTICQQRLRSVMVTPQCHSPGRAPKRASTRVRNSAVQRDFRQQDQRLPALRQTCGDGLQIDLGLARPGDPAQQGGAIAAGADLVTQRVGGRLLVRGQGLAGHLRIEARIGQVARRLDLGQRAHGSPAP